MTIRALVVSRLKTSTSSTVALSDSPRGILNLEQRLRAKAYDQARSQRMWEAMLSARSGHLGVKQQASFGKFMWIYRVQTSHMASYNLGCNTFFFCFAPSLLVRPRLLSGPVCASRVTLLRI